MKKRWWILGLVVILVGGFLGLGALRRGRNRAAAEGEVETAVVERGTLRITVDGSGSISPQFEVTVPFEAGGRVVEILVDTGEVVEAGDVLARLDATDAERSLAEAQLQLRQAAANLAATELDVDDVLNWEIDEDAVERAEADLAAARTDYQTTVKRHALSGDQLTSVEVSLAQARRALEDAQEDYDSAYDPGRDWELGDRRRSGLIEAERERASDALTSAQESLQKAQAAYNLEVAGLGDSGVAGAWSKVLSAEDVLENETEAPDADEIAAARLKLEQQQVSVAQAELNLAQAEEALADMELVASVTGTIAEMDLALGRMVSNGQTGAVLADLSVLEVEIGLDESDIAQVATGQTAIVTLDAFDDVTLEGVITHIAPVAEVTSGVVLYEVTVQLPEADIPVRVGMTADVEVVTRSAADALLVPLKAVRTVNGRSFVLRRPREGEEAGAVRTPAQTADTVGTSAQTADTVGTSAGTAGTVGTPARTEDTVGSSNGTDGAPPQADGALTAEQRQALRARLQEQLGAEGFELAPVTLGVMVDAQVQVLSGLQAGDVVLLTASDGEDDGAGMPVGPGPGLFGRRP